jgi:hypothetical protein
MRKKSLNISKWSTVNASLKRKRKINDLQITTQKTKDRATRTPQITGCELGYFAMIADPSPLLLIFAGHFGFLHE